MTIQPASLLAAEEMAATFAIRGSVAAAALAWLAAAAGAEESVALRTPGGRFLGVAPGGRVAASRFVPGDRETFERHTLDGGRIALKTQGGPFLAVAGPQGQVFTLAREGADPGPAESFLLVPGEGGRTGLRNASGRFMLFGDAAGAAKAPAPSPDQPGPGELADIFHVGDVPAAIQTALGAAAGALVMGELDGKEYAQTRSRLEETYVDLPAPTLKDLRRTRRHRLWTVREEYGVRARLDGQPRIRVLRMPYLRPAAGDGARLLMFAAAAEVPVAGRVSYQAGDSVRAAVNFGALVALDVSGQLRVEKAEGRVTIHAPEVLDLQVQVRKLEISNDVLNAVRRPIADAINHEVGRQHVRILEQANKSVAKAFDGKEIRHPLLEYLGLP